MATAILGPLGASVERWGDTLINKVASEIFGDSDAARSTRVIVYNHSKQDLYFLSSSFDSGGFTPGMQPSIIEAGTVNGYRVESHGVMTGVTGADVTFGLNPSDSTWCLHIVTSNAFGGSVKGIDDSPDIAAKVPDGFTVKSTISVGNANQVDVDFYSAS